MSLHDDPDFLDFVDEFIEKYEIPPSIGDILAYQEAKASIRLDGGTQHA